VVCLLVAGAKAEAACTISVTPVNFGAYDPFSASPDDTTGTITYRCNTNNEDIRIELDTGGAATFATRRMLSGAETLFYNLYQNAARTVIWGDGTSGTYVFTRNNVPRNQNFNLTIFARIDADQDIAAGTYSNTVTALINW
jgi:spore coat protein U-like protein